MCLGLLFMTVTVAGHTFICQYLTTEILQCLPILSFSPSLPCKHFPLTNGSPPAVGLIPILPIPHTHPRLSFEKLEPGVFLRTETSHFVARPPESILQYCETSLRKQISLSHSCHFVPIHKRAWAKMTHFWVATTQPRDNSFRFADLRKLHCAAARFWNCTSGWATRWPVLVLCKASELFKELMRRRVFSHVEWNQAKGLGSYGESGKGTWGILGSGEALGRQGQAAKALPHLQDNLCST